MIALLGLVFLFPAVKGAQRWFDLGYFQLQPSEFSKTACVLALAAVLGRPQVKLRWGRIGQALAVMAVPGHLDIPPTRPRDDARVRLRHHRDAVWRRNLRPPDPGACPVGRWRRSWRWSNSECSATIRSTGSGC